MTAKSEDEHSDIGEAPPGTGLLVVISTILATASLFSGQGLPLILASGLSLVIAVFRPALGLIAMVPVVIAPLVITVQGTNFVYLALFAVEITVILRCLKRIHLFVRPLLLSVAFLVLVTFSYMRVSDRQIVSDNVALSSVLAFTLCIGFAVAVALANPSRRSMFHTLAIAGCINSGYFLVEGQSTVSGRVESEFVNANGVGYIAAFALVASVALFFDERRARWLLLALVPMATLAAAQSRGSLVIAAVGAGVIAFFLIRGWARIPAVLFTLAAAVWLASDSSGDFSSGLFSQRDDASANSSVQTRSALIQLSLDLISRHPFGGVGYRVFPDYSLGYVGYSFNTHNDYLRVAVEVGLPALLLLLALVTLPYLIRTKSKAYQLSMLALGMATLVGPLFANVIHLPPVILPLWIVLGLRWADNALGVKPVRSDVSVS